MSLENYRLPKTDVRLVLRESGGLYSHQAMDTPEMAAVVMAKAMRELDREYVCVVNLDTKLRPISYTVVAIGNLNTSLIPMQNLFKTAILSNAAQIMLLHNHPSGDPTPSKPDIAVTEKIAIAGKLLEIPLVDHLVVGEYVCSIGQLRPDIFDKRRALNIEQVAALVREDAADYIDAPREMAKKEAKKRKRHAR